MTNLSFTAPAGTTIEDLAGRWSLWNDQELTHELEQTMTRSGLYSPAAVADAKALADELDASVAAGREGVAAVDAFLAVDCNLVEQRDRWATVRIIEKHFKIPGRALIRPFTPETAGRPRRQLTGLEQGLVRQCSLASTAKTAIVGALDSLLASGELPKLLAHHIGTDSNGRAETIQTTGTEHQTTSGYPVAIARERRIVAWARPALTRLVAAALPGHPLLYGGASTDHATIQSAILMNVNKVFTDAGIASDPTVKPLSIRNTAARQLHGEAGIEATAEAMGHWDLTALAREIDVLSSKRPAQPRSGR